MNKLVILLLLLATTFLISCNNSAQAEQKVEQTQSTNKVVLASDIQWEKLNPARGDKSPQAGTIWGDRNGSLPTGFLVKFVDGFSSPPHIHNVTYRGMVIEGLVHNDDEAAEKMWMPAGSFWTQPAGASHITAAKGDVNIAYIEIDSGPYLVKPEKEAFDTRERPVNIDKSNLVWLDASETILIGKREGKESSNGPAISFLWGEHEPNKLRGTLIKIPAGFEGEIASEGSVFHAVVIEGKLTYHLPAKKDAYGLEAGSYFSSEGNSNHFISSKKETTIYVRSNEKYTVSPN